MGKSFYQEEVNSFVHSATDVIFLGIHSLDLEQSVPSEKKPRLEYDENGQLVPPVEGDEAKKEAAAGEESDTPNLIKPQKPFLKYVKWARGDGEFFVGNVKGKKIMSTEDENDAMAQMISSFIEGEPLKVRISHVIS